MMNDAEISLAGKDFDMQEFEKRFNEKLAKLKEIGMKAAIQYTDTYRQGGTQMRFCDLFRKYKRLEKEFLYGTKRVREKTEDDLLDLGVYTILFWIYLDELSDVTVSL